MVRAIENSPLVSAIIPVYNGEKFVAEAIQSALGQTYPNIEIIVVDDGSTDNTVDVLRSFGDSIIWVSQKNAGPGPARNTALRLARGRYIALLDADDIWLPEKTALQVEALQRNPDATMAFGLAIRSGANSSKLLHLVTRSEKEPYGLPDLLLGNMVPTLTTVFIREVALSIGGFDPVVNGAEDWDLWIRLARLGPVCHINTILAIYRDHDEQISKNLYKQSRGELITFKKHSKVFKELFSPRLYKTELAKRLSVAALESVKVELYQEAIIYCIHGMSTMHVKQWPLFMKIIIESLLGSRRYANIVFWLKAKHLLEV